MLEIGKMNLLRIVKEVDFGLYLDGGDMGEILIPTRYVPETYEIGDDLEVFVYCDSEDRLIATTEMPKAPVGEFAYLSVVEVTKVGAFLDWGLPKDLFVPFREQQQRMKKGESYLVRIYLDDSDRIAASSKLENFLNQSPPPFTVGEKVTLTIWDRSELGYKALINETHLGLIFDADIFQVLTPGDSVPGIIKNIREDGKIDLRLEASRHETVSGIAGDILAKIEKNHGCIALNDKSTPAEITKTFGVSKKVFKQAIGSLYKKRLITITTEGIRLVK